MISLIEDNREAIVALCEQYGVQRLALFGSAVTGTFDPARSDLDFAVDFTDYSPGIGKRFMGFIVALDEQFPDFPVHISSIHEGSSDHFRNQLQRTAVTLYERERTTTAA